MSADQAYAGTGDRSSATSEWNRLDFAVRSILGRMATATLVRVKSATGLTVDVQPLVNQLDGAKNAVAHGVIHNLPVWRAQAGPNAVIMDPVPDDIGLAVFAHSDISSVKANKGPANPGSLRRNSWSDGIYLGGLLNAAPTRFLRFLANGAIDLVGDGTLTINSGAGNIRLVADMTSTTGALAAGNGATGTFLDKIGRTITVTNGIVTGITGP